MKCVEKEKELLLDHHQQQQLLEEFYLFETSSKFYIFGTDKSNTFWRVLKIERAEASKLSMHEDSTTYTKREYLNLLNWIKQGNIKTGGLQFVTTFYGIIGVVQFSGLYYMLLITKRSKVGVLCGHDVYTVGKSEMIPIANSSVQPNKADCRNEKRNKELLSKVDLTKDFFFSYSYNVMHSVQKNLQADKTRLLYYGSMFVWNEYLTREFRNNIKTTCWTVALVYGFFKQVELSESGKNCTLTLIARRSKYHAGPRYKKRGVNESGKVANDVETEQIVIYDVPGGCSSRISSVVQNRGSIPLFWSQESSHFNIRPNIILSNKDPHYDATRLHFDNLVVRYGLPPVILNLIKSKEKNPRESVLGAEFAKVIEVINQDLPEEMRLGFLDWDLSKYSKNHAVDALELLRKVADTVLDFTNIFCCQMSSNSRLDGVLNSSSSEQNNGGNCLPRELSNQEKVPAVKDDGYDDASTSCYVMAPTIQKGVLRTNCIDCLDRTNVAQYAYGMAALERQLNALGFLQSSSIGLDDPLADNLMRIYECMGDTLALQYGGSAAHNKIFCKRRGQCCAAIWFHEVLRTFQRYISNAYMDEEKQDAINVFLGYLHPQGEEPALSGPDQHLDIGISGTQYDEKIRSIVGPTLAFSDAGSSKMVREQIANGTCNDIARGKF